MSDRDSDETVKLRGKGQASRLGRQHEEAGGPIGIFGHNAQLHDMACGEVAEKVVQALSKRFPELHFRYRNSIAKKEINERLSRIDKRLGSVLFVKNASVKPDGGIIEVEDKNGQWRIVLVGESKHQGNDIEKIQAGVKQGKEKDADLMVAGNAIERVHKNISELRNYMLGEKHFPYVVFLQGSN
ncbi:EcoRI family type II restriction endonuclease, partial [Nostoc sp. NIES-2111]